MMDHPNIDTRSDIHSLGMLPGYDLTDARAISSNGVWVAGHCRAIGGPTGAFVWSETTDMIGLGRFGGATSWALGVNNAGEVVGWSDTGGGKHSQAAFLWQDGIMFDLNLLADTGGKIHLQLAKDINNAGHVVGLMSISRPVSESHGFLLIPNAR
jgi:probable HAF family extracellular repeat protein